MMIHAKMSSWVGMFLVLLALQSATSQKQELDSKNNIDKKMVRPFRNAGTPPAANGTSTQALTTPSSTTVVSVITPASTTSCHPTQFECGSGSKICLHASLRCNHMPDCPDGSDESQCNVCDETRMFRCQSGQCITKFWRCDGDVDCLDHTDEQGCPVNKGETGCSNSFFECSSGECVPRSWVCDGENDCNDHTDETDCKNMSMTCEPNQFRCTTETCISSSFLCDGELDCPDGEDEKDCEGKSECSISADRYECTNKECIPLKSACDQKPDCSDASDEGGHCSETCKVTDCSQVCTMTPQGPRCTCHDGFKLNAANECEDVDECAAEMSVCDHFCKNTIGSFNCSCAEAYELQSDGKTCKTSASGHPLLFMAHGDDIRVLDLDLTMYSQVYAGTKQFIAVGYDPVDDMVYMSNDVGVFRIPRRGGVSPISVVNEGIGLIEGLAVDWLGRNLYMTDSGLSHILVCSLSGTSCRVLVDNVAHPRAIQLDLENRHVYWSDVERSVIERSGMDGSDRTVIISEGMKWPNGLWLDAPARRLYVADAHTNEVFHVNYDGLDKKHLAAASVDHPFAIAVWEEHLYWSDWDHEHIRSCLKRTGKQMKEVVKGTRGGFFGLTVFHPVMFREIYNPCKFHMCSHLCLLSSSSIQSYTCACPSEMNLSGDGHSCFDIPERTYPFIADGNKIYQLSPRLHGHTTLSEWKPNMDLQWIGDFAYDPIQDSVIVSDVWSGTIYNVHRRTGVAVTIVENVSRAVGVDIDWLRRNVYWVDGVKKAVEVVRDNGAFRTELVTSLQHPSDIALAPLLGFMYVSDVGTEAFIMRCGLDGSFCHKIVTSDIKQPIALTFEKDPNIKRLYWCDHALGRIESVAEDGSDRRVIINLAKKPGSFLVSGLFILWAEEGTSLVYQTSKTQNTSVRVRQLELGTPENGVRSLKLVEVGWKLPEQITKTVHPCQQLNSSCSQLCLGNNLIDKVCACSFGYKLDADLRSCEVAKCRDDQFNCFRSHTCIPGTWRCDSTPDCQDGEDEEQCLQLKTCEENEFRCSSGSCVNKVWTCDGVRDCEDGSDENLDECRNATCSSVHWKCKSGKCIPQMWVCDQEKECDDGSDELDCSTSCPDHKFTCNDGFCVPKMWHCDGDKDCRDGSDEEGCSDSCVDSDLKCDNGKCVPQYAQCDGEDDCGDGSDEAPQRCPTVRLRPSCQSGQILCETLDALSPPVCIHQDSICNGVRDCPLGEDEDCDHCARNEYKCKTRGCIPRRWVCDGEEDCTDGSDEGQAASCKNLNASVPMLGRAGLTSTPACSDDKFQCETGECISKALVCDDSADCSDGSDEGSYCEKSCKNNGGCQHICRSGPVRRVCSCWTGFKLAPDQSSCVDVKECDDESTCGHVCEEKHGYYVCSCLPGYSMGPDRRSCKPQGGEDWLAVVRPKSLMMLTDSFNLKKKMNIDSSIVATSLEYQPESKSFIYADRIHGIIGKMSIGKTEMGEAKVLFREKRQPQGVSLDPVTNSVYFSERFDKPQIVEGNATRSQRSTDSTAYSLIQVCSMDDGVCSIVYKGRNEEIPATQVAYVARRFFFCTNNLLQNAGNIMSANMNGKFAWAIRNKVEMCGSMALDEAKERVYWTDLIRKTVETVKWSGGGHRIVQENLHSPIGLTVNGDWVMWLDTHSHEVVRCSKYKTSQCKRHLMSTAGSALISGRPSTLATTASLRAASVDECKSKNCTHHCMLLQDNKSECMCNTGYVVPSLLRPNECVKMKACDRNPCQGGGVCESHSDTEFVCRCPEDRKGILCEVSMKPTTDDDNDSSNATLGFCLFFITLVAIICGMYWYKKRPFAFWKGKGGSFPLPSHLRKRYFTNQQSLRFANPGFGVMSQTMTSNGNMTSNYSLPSTPPVLRGSHNFENPFFKTDEHMPDTSVDSAIVSTTDSTSINIAPHHVDLTTPQPTQPTLKPPAERKVEWDLSPFQPM